MSLGPAARLQKLIDHLDTACFRGCPDGVGLKTAIQARELGLVEFSGDTGKWTYRLTERGDDCRTALDRTIIGAAYRHLSVAS